MNQENSILKEIEINKEHIKNFNMELDTGTKKMKKRFHYNAIKERNKYVDCQKKKFICYKKYVYYVLNEKIKQYIPQNKSELFEKQQKENLLLKDNAIKVNDKLSVSFKLGLDLLISDIADNIDLDKLNVLLNYFIKKFKDINIELTADDFSYTMFTKKYMSVYFENFNSSDFSKIMAECFEKIYFECPKIIMQLKRNLEYVIEKYDTQLNDFMNEYISNLLNSLNLDKDKVVFNYLKAKDDLMWDMIGDSYLNLSKFLSKEKSITDFLDDSNTFLINFNKFTGNVSYENMSEDVRKNYNNVMIDFYGVLKELNEFYRYEGILKDLKKRYSNKDKIKDLFATKNKEVSSLKKNCNKYNKEFLKASKKNIFGKINKNKMKMSKLKLNSEMITLNHILLEFDDILFNKKFIDNVNDASSIYDFFNASLLSSKYLEKQFIDKFSKEDDFSLENEFDRFFSFLYNAYNSFLRKSPALTEFNMTDIITSKYQILGLNVNKDQINRDNINNTMDIVNYIVTVLKLNSHDINIKVLYNICQYKEIVPPEHYEEVILEII